MALRRRKMRDLLTLAGIVLVLSAIVGANIYMRKEGLRGQYEKLRAAFEAKHKSEGVSLVDWKELHVVKGRRATGAVYPDSLKQKDGHLVNICGFMSPVQQFKNVSEFMLLPVPLTCYFCDAPPMRDIVQVRLQKTADMVNEPVLIGGRLELHEGPNQMFFYTIKDAKWNEAVKDEELTEKVTDQAHKAHLVEGFRELREGVKEEKLDTGFEPVIPPGASPAPATAAPVQPAESAPAPAAAGK